MKTITRYLHQLCGVYTVSVLALMLLNVALGSSPTATTINTAAFLWLFVFAGILAGANLLISCERLVYSLRVALHCVLTVGSAFLLLYLPISEGAASSGKLMMFFLMLLVYWVIMALYLVLRPRKREKEVKAEKKESYRSMFGSKDAQS